MLLLLVAVLLLGVNTALAQQAMQDVIYLKNGSVVRGVIVEQVPNSSVKIRTSDGSEFVYPISDVLKMTKEASLQQTSRKSPLGAFALSWLFPGGGQYYNGGTSNVVKGLIQSGTWIGGAVLALHLDTQTVSYSYSCGTNCYESGSNQETDYKKFDIGLGMMVGASLWSMVDAPLSAMSINKKAQGGAHMMVIHGVGLDAYPTRRGVGAQLSYQFR
jgi:hypothetical protein